VSRLMSVSLTEDAVRERRKTVTRRLGWAFLKPGDKLTLARKVMGRRRKDGTVEPLVRIAEVEVVSARREPLSSIGPGETALEGFPDMTGGAFVEFFCSAMRCTPDTWVTRIEWRYIEGQELTEEQPHDR
jgi:hypothetical protein